MKNNFVGSDHYICCQQVAKELHKKGYVITTEYEIPVPIELQKIYERKKIVIDVHGVKAEKEILVEVGYLSQNSIFFGRIELLKKLRPKAKILHVHQWKNYLSIYDFENEKLMAMAKKIALKNGNNGLVAAISKGYILDGFAALLFAEENDKEAYSDNGAQMCE